MKIARLRQPALSALAVLLISGAGIAFAGNSSTNHRAAVAPVAIQAAAPANAVTAPAVEPADTDTDTLQEGDQTTPDTAAETAAEKAGAETEKAGAESDGPGGHADDPNDPNADHQFEGEE